jgi:site-specific DNA recombinase
MSKIGYARVSSIEQQEDKGALRKQIERLRNAGCEHCYYDIQSRTTEVREGLHQMVNYLKLAPKGSVSELVVIRLDRIGSSSKLFYSLLEVLRSHNMKLTALDQCLDTSSVGGELTIDILLAAAKFEVGMLGSRIRAERKHRMSQGKSHWYPPLGWAVQDNKYVRDERLCVSLIEGKRSFKVWELAEFVFQVFIESGSVGRTCHNLNSIFGTLGQVKAKLLPEVKNRQIITQNLDEIDLSPRTSITHNRYPWTSLRWSPSGLKDFLTNPVHAGGTPFNTTKKQGGRRKHFDLYEVNWDTHEGIISRQQHEEVKKIIRNNSCNKWAAATGSDANPFANLAKCARCGGAVTRGSARTRKDGVRESWYQCSHYTLGRCDSKKMISYSNLDKQVADLLVTKATKLADLVNLNNEPTEESPQIKSLRESLSFLEKSPFNPAIEKAKDEIREEIARAISSENAVAKHSEILREELVQMFSDRSYWDSRTLDDKKRILSRLVRRVVVDGSTVLRVDLL